MKTHRDKRRITFTLLVLAVFAGAAVLPLVSASCSTQPQRADDPSAYERLRSLTRGGVLPTDEGVAAGLANDYAGTRTGALARVLQARIRAARGDFAGAAALLDAREIRTQTTIGDYALFLRAEALEKAGRATEARAAFEELAREFPTSLRARDATLRAAQLTFQEEAQAAAVPVFLKSLTEADDDEALLLAARAYERSGEPTRALGAYRRLYFYAPVSAQTEAEAAAAFARLGSTNAPANADEAITRAEKLYRAKRFREAVDAYGDAFTRFPQTATPQAQLRRGLAAFNSRRAPETVAALTSVSPAAGETRAEALYNLVQHYVRAKQWAQARVSADDLRRAFPQSKWTLRGLTTAAQAARDAGNKTDAFYFAQSAVQLAPGAAEVAGAQFEIAWSAHEAKDFAQAARLLTEHLAVYADRNTDNRGRAGYWAARNAERAGQLNEARALYRAMLARYDANWYGYLSRQRLEALGASAQGSQEQFPPDSLVARAIANLQHVTVAEETAGAAEDERLAHAEQLSAVALDDAAQTELDRALETAAGSPRLNLAKARLLRARGNNLEAFNVLRKSYPDYSQMKVEEMTPDEWDVFYPLAYWSSIRDEARARSLDPYMVAGLIRQESVFNPRASSVANAYGLMQLLIGTAQMMARRNGIQTAITRDALFEPTLNIKLGTTYLRDNLDKFGRIEYVAAAYNAGPGRAVQWRASLPPPMDEWAEAVPFKETRGYVQGVMRNTLQYRRLYDEQGRFRPEVGSRAVRGGAQVPGNVRPRRISNDEEE